MRTRKLGQAGSCGSPPHPRRPRPLSLSSSRPVARFPHPRLHRPSTHPGGASPDFAPLPHPFRPFPFSPPSGSLRGPALVIRHASPPQLRRLHRRGTWKPPFPRTVRRPVRDVRGAQSRRAAGGTGARGGDPDLRRFRGRAAGTPAMFRQERSMIEQDVRKGWHVDGGAWSPDSGAMLKTGPRADRSPVVDAASRETSDAKP